MSNKLEMRFDFDGLIQLLARHLYSEKNVFIRELIQNAHDSILRRKKVDADGYGGRIDIETRPSDLRFVVKDNGIGMNKADIQEYLSTVGRGATRLEKESGDVEGLIGQFGIGFLSAFVVASEVEVRTRKVDEQQGWVWCNTGSKDYELEPCEVESVGTTVIVKLRDETEKGVIHEEEVQKVIRHYADMLAIPIHLNSSSNPVNTIRMPWEQSKQKDAVIDCFVYLEKHMRDSVLEVIPFDLKDDINASGVLYITRTRTFQTEMPRNVRVFINRMYLCSNAEILPKWATFINGIVNTSMLTPTAARDNFVRDDQAGKLRERLGDLVIGHLDGLSREDPERFSQILRYHDLSIKAACYYYDEFFKKFHHLLEWRTNALGQTPEKRDGIYSTAAIFRTLPEITKLLQGHEQGAKTLPYFADSNSANQYFDMADAANTLVVDASYHFEQKLLEEYAKLDEVKLKLVRVDREDDPNVFKRLKEGENEARLKQLAELMSDVLRAVGTNVRVEACHFQPAELAAVMRSTERSRAQQKAEDLLSDPNVSEDLRQMALEMSAMARQSAFRLVINADNPLIQALAAQDLSKPDKDLHNIMLGIHNNAILYNQELMTPDNARVFHDQLYHLLQRNLDYFTDKTQLAEAREQIEREKMALRPKQTKQAQHLVFFMMTPFREEYAGLVDTVREVIEDRWHCQLFLAKDKYYEGRIQENIFAHMATADAFIAEITEATANVMFELGAVWHDDLHSRKRPVILLREGNNRKSNDTIADLRGYLDVAYGETMQKGQTLVDYLDTEMQSRPGIKALLDEKTRQRYVSPRHLKILLGEHIRVPDKVLTQLSESYPTQEAWHHAINADIETHLGELSDLAPIIIKRIQAATL